VLQVVCIKQVADTETRVKVAADGKNLDPAGVTWILNPYDEFAIEQALAVREKQGAGEVVVASLGGAGVQSTLRNALAMGADRAIHLRLDPPVDSLGVARALAAEIAPLKPDMVWLGRQAVDDDAAQVGPMLAYDGAPRTSPAPRRRRRATSCGRRIRLRACRVSRSRWRRPAAPARAC